MVKIVIVEDDENYASKMKDYLRQYFSDRKREYSVEYYSNGMDFLEEYKGDADVVLMDIKMPGMNGMETARSLRETDQYVCIIFVTNMAQYALKGYEVGARYYILKPLEYGNFTIKLDNVLSNLPKRKSSYIYIKGENGIVKVDISDIRYVASEGHTIYFYTNGGEYTKRSSMKEVREAIGDKRFASCGNSYLVNMDYITTIEKDDVVVGNDRLPISRLKKKEFMNTVTLYFGGRLL